MMIMKALAIVLVFGTVSAVPPLEKRGLPSRTSTTFSSSPSSSPNEGHVGPSSPPPFHSMIQGKRELCRNNFRCPEHSTPIPNRRCYDTIDDCACDVGYFRQGDTCTARPGLCSQEYADMVESKVQQVEFWISMAENTPDSEKEEQISYIYKMNDVFGKCCLNLLMIIVSSYLTHLQPVGMILAVSRGSLECLHARCSLVRAFWRRGRLRGPQQSFPPCVTYAPPTLFSTCLQKNW